VPAVFSHIASITVGFFALFLIASPPHRVHHFFEQQVASDDRHQPHDHEQGPDHEQPAQPKSPDCGLQTAAQSIHATLVTAAAPIAIELLHSPSAVRNSRLISTLRESPRHSRAPPTAF